MSKTILCAAFMWASILGTSTLLWEAFHDHPADLTATHWQVMDRTVEDLADHIFPT